MPSPRVLRAAALGAAPLVVLSLCAPAAAQSAPPSLQVSTRVGVDGAAVVAELPYGQGVSSDTVVRVRNGETVVGESPFVWPDRSAYVVDTSVAPGASATYTVSLVQGGTEGPRSEPVSATVPDRPAPQAGSYDAVVLTGRYGEVMTPVAVTARPGRMALKAASGGSGASATVRWTSDLAPGTYVSTAGAPAAVRVEPGGFGCDGYIEQVEVTDAAVRADGTPEVLTLRWRADCPERGTMHAGEIRWRSTHAWAAALVDPRSIDVLATRVGTTVQRSVSYRNAGTQPLTIGAVRISGAHPGSFSVRTTDCAGTLAPGVSCTIGLDIHPDDVDYRHARLDVEDGTAAGVTSTDLRVLGSRVPGPTEGVRVALGVGRAQITWDGALGSPYDYVHRYDVWRTTVATGMTVKVGSVSEYAHKSVIDPSPQPGQRYTYAVSGTNNAGTGPRSAAGTVTIPTVELIYVNDAGGFKHLATPGAAPVRDHLYLGSAPSYGPAAVAPDGARLASTFAGSSSAYPTGLFVLAPDAGNPRRLTTGAHFDPTWTPDSRTVLFIDAPYNGTRRLMRVPAAGGTPQAVPGATDVVALSVLDARTVVAAVHRGAEQYLTRIDIVTGAQHDIAGTDGALGVVVSRDGRSLAWTARNPQDQRFTEVRIGALGGPFRTLVTSLHSPIVDDWSLDGRSVFVSYSPDGSNWGGLFGQIPLDGSPSVQWGEGHGVAVRFADQVAPTLRRTLVPARAVTAPSVRMSWTASDTGGSGVGTHEIRTRRARYDGDYGTWSAPAPLASSTTVHNLAAGYDTCLEVRSKDRHGNASAWTGACTSRPLDDRSLRASTGWTRTTATGVYAGTVSTARRAGATLTLPASRAARGWLVATRCPTCGSVQVLVGGRSLGTVSLRATTTQRQVLVPLPGAGVLRSGSLVLRTTSAAPVTIDGLALARS